MEGDLDAVEASLRPFVEAERSFVEFQAQGDHEAAVRCLENVLRNEQATVQEMQDTFLSTLFERLAVGYNTLGMKYLKEGSTEVSCKFFEKAEALTDPANLHMNPESRLVLRAVTYNNMGCFYKSMSKLHTALQYLRKAQKIEERSMGKCQNPAGTHLNLCALLSQMGKHQEALAHSKMALDMLESQENRLGQNRQQQQGGSSQVTLTWGTPAGDRVIYARKGQLGVNFDKSTMPMAVTSINPGTQAEDLGVEVGWTLKGVDSTDVSGVRNFNDGFNTLIRALNTKAGQQGGGASNGESMICVAYFNMGAEYEHLKKPSEALWAYDQAYRSCLRELGEDHPLSQQISNCLTQLKSKSKRGGR
jgi:tetratricopeptide (TPR) repeat protein